MSNTHKLASPFQQPSDLTDFEIDVLRMLAEWRTSRGKFITERSIDGLVNWSADGTRKSSPTKPPIMKLTWLGFLQAATPQEATQHRAVYPFDFGNVFVIGDSVVEMSPRATKANSTKRRRREVKPKWDRDRHELFYDGELVRKFVQWKAAKNPIDILDEFQSLGWPKTIDNPLKPSKNLAEAIRTLNNGRRGQTAVVFGRDGSGNEGITWESKPNGEEK